MNTVANRLTHIVMIAATIAAFVMIQPAKAAPVTDTNAVSSQAAKVVMLPRVMVTGKREQATNIVYLQRVTVTGKRIESNELMQARKDSKPANLLVAMR